MRTIINGPDTSPAARIQDALRRFFEMCHLEPMVERQEEDGMLKIWYSRRLDPKQCSSIDIYTRAIYPVARLQPSREESEEEKDNAAGNY